MAGGPRTYVRQVRTRGPQGWDGDEDGNTHTQQFNVVLNDLMFIVCCKVRSVIKHNCPHGANFIGFELYRGS